MLITIIDTETTGLSPTNSQIIEVAGALFDVKANSIIALFSTLLPGLEKGVPNPTENLNHISSEMLDNAFVKEGDILPLLRMIMVSDYVVAHNAAFDKKFIEQAVAKYSVPGSVNAADFKWICSMNDLDLTSAEDKKNNKKMSSKKLTHIAADHECSVKDAHRALPDVMMLCSIFKNIPDLYEQIKSSSEPKHTYKALVDYNEKDKAKAQGFIWNAPRKEWVKVMKDSQTKSLPFAVELIGEAGFLSEQN